MQLMPTRYETLQRTLAGYLDSGVSLVSKEAGTFVPTWSGDDLGIYYFIPKIAKTFSLPLDAAIGAFFISIIIAAVAVAIISFFSMTRNNAVRLYCAVSMVVLGAIAYTIGDVYILSAAAPALCIPAFLLFMRRQSAAALCGLFAISAIAGYANQIRSHSGTAVLVFFAVFLLLHEMTMKKKALSLFIIACGFFIPSLHFKLAVAERNSYLLKQDRAYAAPSTRHVFWHNAYLGLGFLNNKHGILPKDESGDLRARAIDPNVQYFSNEYENILKQEVFRIIRANPGFVATTVAAKTGVLAAFLLLALNIGVFPLWRRTLSGRDILPFLMSGIFAALPGLIFIPYNSYLLGSISIASLLAVHAFSKREAASRKAAG